MKIVFLFVLLSKNLDSYLIYIAFILYSHHLRHVT